MLTPTLTLGFISATGVGAAEAFPPPGVVLAWGGDGAGQLGDGTIGPAQWVSPQPVDLSMVPAGERVVAADAGGRTISLAVTNAGDVYAWGDMVATPRQVGLPPGVAGAAVAAGVAHSLVLDTAGEVYAWGFDGLGNLGDGQVGNPDGVAAPQPVLIPPGVGVTAISAGVHENLALTSTGEVYAWGDDRFGQLGDGVVGTPAYVPTPQLVDLPPGVSVATIAAGGGHSLASTTTGEVYEWGRNVPTPQLVDLPAGVSVTAVAASAGMYYSHFNFALAATGEVYAWGEDRAGQLGDGTVGAPDFVATPQLVHLPAGMPVAAVDAGVGHGVVLARDGRVYGWGGNSMGAAGGSPYTALPTPRLIPLSVPPASQLTAISAGEHSLAVVTPLDLEPPVLGLPGDMTVEATSPDGASVSYTATVSDAFDDDVSVLCDPPSGSTFELDTTTVTCSAADDSGNTATGTFTVTVVDTTGPVMHLPADVSVAATSSGGAVVTYTVAANDTADPDPEMTCTPASGSPFPIGITTVTCQATDRVSNHSSGSFTVTVTPAADLSITKTVDRALAEPGQIITYTLKVANAGPTGASGVRIADSLPAGVSFHSVSGPGCGHTGPTVTCDVGTLAADGTATVVIQAVVDPVLQGASHDHQLGATKVEEHLAVAAGASASATVTCPTGYAAVDGSVRVDHVDQGTGSFADVHVVASRGTADGHGWTGTVRNTSTGQAQAKVNVVCLSERTVSGESHTHGFTLGGFVTAENVTGTRTLTCPAGTAVSPGWSFDSGTGPVSTRRVEGGWVFDIGAGVADVSIRCLSTRLAAAGDTHAHDLVLTHLTGELTVPAGETVEQSLTCPVGFKGITAWADLDAGLVPLGTDPQPITRLWRFYNPTGAAWGADYGLACLAVRTADGTITNTGTVTATTRDPDSSDNTGSVTMAVTRTGVAITSGRVRVVTQSGRTLVRARVASSGPRTVTVRLVAVSPVAGTSVDRGDTLAVTRTRVTSGSHSVQLPVRRAAAGPLRHGDITTARLVLLSPNGARTVRVVTVD